MESKELLKRAIHFFPKRITSHLPRGIDCFIDIRNSLPGYQVKTIFDVGANIGQSAIEYASLFPNSRIYSFEPIAKSYSKLIVNTQKFDNVSCFKVAMSSKESDGIMVSHGASTDNYLLDASPDLSETKRKRIEHVKMTTIDLFCEEHSIDHINFLKIDTEGHDLEVVIGSSGMIREGNIDFINTEVGMNLSNKKHVNFIDMISYMSQNNFYLFGVYVQTRELP